MLIIIDKKIPLLAKENLKEWGSLLELETENIVYPAISGHPDIFLFQYHNNLIISPEFYSLWGEKLNSLNVNYKVGISKLGNKFPTTVPYNIAAADNIFIGNSKTTDKSILELAKNNIWVESPQSYSRCNTIILNNTNIITSEITVHKAIDNSLYIDPKQIYLEGFPNGFFGGCAGYFNNKLFLIGSLKEHHQGKEIKEYCKRINIEIIELYEGPFFDGGGIFFL